MAQKRLARGLKLNRSEAIALIAFQLQEYVRDGKLNVADLMQLGKEFLGRRHVMEGVEESIHDIQIEGTFQVGSTAFSLYVTELKSISLNLLRMGQYYRRFSLLSCS